MKIKNIYVSAFGGLKDFSLDLCDGMQVIYGDNEAGKTTITEFIKAMFYGTGKRAAGQVISIRDKYTPFDGTPAGGRILFEKGGRDYIIERLFRKSDATDKVTITDVAAGKIEPCAPDIGRELFGIGVGAFERSVFIGNMPVITADDAAQGEINQKLSNAVLSGQDDVSYAKVLKRIDDARLKLISKSGRTGSQIADINECNSLIETLGETDRLARKKQEMIAALGVAEEKLNAVTAEYDATQKLLDNAKDIENAQKLKEYLDLKRELDETTEKLTLEDGTVADEMFLKKFEFGFSKLGNMEAKIEAAKKELESLRSAAGLSDSSPEQIRAKINAATEQMVECDKDIRDLSEKADKSAAREQELSQKLADAQNAKKPFNAALVIPGIIAIVAGAVLYFALSSKLAPAAVAAIGALLCLLGFIIKPAAKGEAEKLNSDISAAARETNALTSEIMLKKSEKSNLEAKIESYNIALNFGISGEQKIAEKQAFIESETATLQAEQKKLLKFFGLSEYVNIPALKEKMEQLYGLAESQKQIKLRLNYLSRDLGNASYEEAAARLAALGGENTGVDLIAQKEKAKKLADNKAEALEVKTQLETELKTAFRAMRDPEDLRREIAVLKEKIAAKQAFYDAATVAYEVLEQSFITARQSFGGVLEEETLKNFKELTGGAYGAITISHEFDITAEKNGVFGRHELEYLSRGTKDQAYLALRLAMAKLITDKEPLPVVLDDSLSQYDDKRFLAAMDFLKKYAAGAQVCLFTCHNFVANEAANKDIKVLKI